jgi:hypothetical protein
MPIFPQSGSSIGSASTAATRPPRWTCAGRCSAGSGFCFFAEDALPGLSLTRITPGQIARVFAHHRDANLPADFD